MYTDQVPTPKKAQYRAESVLNGLLMALGRSTFQPCRASRAPNQWMPTAEAGTSSRLAWLPA
jgi:hypothetical protein